MHPLNAIILVGYALVVLFAARRSRFFGVFAAIVLGFPTLVGIALRGHLGPFDVLLPVLQAATYAHFALLVLHRERPKALRIMSVAALWFVASTFLAVPWAVAAAFGFDPWVPWLPFAIATIGLWESLRAREDVVDYVLDGADMGALRRATAVSRVPDQTGRPLEIIQITDPHLGPFMPVERLRKICQRAVERNPDLILITGDMMTMESHRSDMVEAALAPLEAYRGRVFACLGNHDYEALSVLTRAYERYGIRLLVDDAAVVETPSGRVQIIGCDFRWRDRAAHLRSVFERFPKPPGALRIVLLHDPGAFAHIPEGEGELVLSGHTHGGQVGLVTLGLPHTFLSLVSSIPDHGPWARGRDRLYVHRAQGHYGFPIRIGVPAEESLLRIHRV